MTTIKVCLFDGRHDLPENAGAIIQSFDFETMKPEYSELFNEQIFPLFFSKEKFCVELYVTGLTPALTDVIREFAMAECLNSLVLLHFNHATSDYVKQYMQVYDA